MTFWDSSAIVPLFVQENDTPTLQRLRAQSGPIAIWWATPTEVLSAIRAKRRARLVTASVTTRLVSAVTTMLPQQSFEVEPSEAVRVLAAGLLERHPLSAADALQLAAFLSVGGGTFVCLDRRLRDAALAEGAAVLP